MNPQKAKGDRAELEIQELLRGMGYPSARRMLAAGRLDDVGDIDGVWNTSVQVANWKDVTQAVRVKPVECEEQRKRAGNRYAVTAIRLRGGVWRMVQTPEQWVRMHSDLMDSMPTFINEEDWPT